MKTIGVIGGGQLGRMFTLDAKRMGYDVIVLDPTPQSPCGQVADEQIVAKYDDLAAVTKLGETTDIVTYEFENIAIESVMNLEKKGFKVTPGSDVLRVTQDRLLEKQFLRDAGVPVGNYAKVDRIDDLTAAAATAGYPAVLKTIRGGYDGKHQWLADSASAAKAAFAAGKGQTLIFEQYVPFIKELSVIAVRNQHNEIVTYPVAENVHDHGILAMSIVPARISEDTAKRAQAIARIIAQQLKIVGVFCVEFFLMHEGELMVNEIAPRPHNSGHYSMDAMPCSQYEQHIRAICELPLAPPQLLSGAVMMNILGEGKGDRITGVDQLLAVPGIVLHMYGKKHAVERRKMGHFTVLDNDLEAAIQKGKEGHAKLGWW
ncbi:MAG: 5-(carboxyamino)imidazole ribonucleotide synthase [Vulcanimicrobiaceae bacterium]